MALIKYDGGRMDSGLDWRFRAGCRQDRESAVVLLDLGRYDWVKLNCVKNRAHLAWHELRCLAVLRYSRFLGLVNTIRG